jgi:hypothetical protein
MQHRRVGKRTQRPLRWALQDEFLMAIGVQLMNAVLRYPRVRLCVQDSEGSGVPSRHDAHIVPARHPGRRIACLKSTRESNSHPTLVRRLD